MNEQQVQLVGQLALSWVPAQSAVRKQLVIRPPAVQCFQRTTGIPAVNSRLILGSIAAIAAGLRPCYLLEGISSSQAKKLVEGVLAALPHIIIQTEASGQHLQLALLVINGCMFLTDLHALVSLRASLDKFAARTCGTAPRDTSAGEACAIDGGIDTLHKEGGGSHRAGRPASVAAPSVQPSAAVLASSGLPCVIAVHRGSLSGSGSGSGSGGGGTPTCRVLLGDAWQAWRGRASAALRAILNMAHAAAAASIGQQSSTSAGTGGAGAGTPSAPTVTLIPQPVHITTAALRGLCPVALAGLLLGYPCVYDCTPLHRLANPSVVPVPVPCSTAGLASTLREQEEWPEDFGDGAGGSSHCLNGQTLIIHSCAFDVPEGTVGHHHHQHQAQALDVQLPRLDFSYPKHCLPLYSLEGYASGQTLVGNGSSTPSPVYSPAAGRMAVLAHVSAWKRRVTSAAQGSIILSAQGGQGGHIIPTFQVREETPDAVAL